MDVQKYPFEDIPLDQGPVEARPDVVLYTSAALTEELVVSGVPHLLLYASSDCDDTDWHVKVTDVHPDGRSLKVTQGCLRGSFRESLRQPSPLVPHAVYRFEVELTPLHHAFLLGHRLRVSVTSSNFPWFARSMNRFGPIGALADPRVATNSIQHTEPHPSCITLPVIRGSVGRMA
jgi:putative CocE/NonD family hydrolase